MANRAAKVGGWVRGDGGIIQLVNLADDEFMGTPAGAELRAGRAGQSDREDFYTSGRVSWDVTER